MAVGTLKGISLWTTRELDGEGRGAVDRAKGKRVVQELCCRWMPEVADLGLDKLTKVHAKARMMGYPCTA